MLLAQKRDHSVGFYWCGPVVGPLILPRGERFADAALPREATGSMQPPEPDGKVLGGVWISAADGPDVTVFDAWREFDFVHDAGTVPKA